MLGTFDISINNDIWKDVVFITLELDAPSFQPNFPTHTEVKTQNKKEFLKTKHRIAEVLKKQ